MPEPSEPAAQHVYIGASTTEPCPECDAPRSTPVHQEPATKPRILNSTCARGDPIHISNECDCVDWGEILGTEPAATSASTQVDLWSTADAVVWAREFMRIYREKGMGDDGEGWMIGWFAAAIEKGRSEGAAALARARAELESARKAIADYETGITWDTTCIEHAHKMDWAYARHLELERERDQARAEVDRLTEQHEQMLVAYDRQRIELDRMREVVEAVEQLTGGCKDPWLFPTAIQPLARVYAKYKARLDSASGQGEGADD